MRKLNKALSILLMAAIMAFIMLTSAEALVGKPDISIINGIETKWMLKDSGIHRGSKALTYCYTEPDADLALYVKSGISKWGSSISLTEVTNSMGELHISADSRKGLNYIAASLAKAADIHCTSAEIRVNLSNFNRRAPGLSAEQLDELKANTIAHMIGHIFGLDHVSDASSIMYEHISHTEFITSNDLNGMSIVTHTHTNHIFTNYSDHSPTQHRAYCGICGGYTYESHSYDVQTGRCTKCTEACVNDLCKWINNDSIYNNCARSELNCTLVECLSPLAFSIYPVCDQCESPLIHNDPLYGIKHTILLI